MTPGKKKKPEIVSAAAAAAAAVAAARRRLRLLQMGFLEGAEKPELSPCTVLLVQVLCSLTTTTVENVI